MPRDNFKGHPRRKARRERAALRQLARDSLSTNQQLDVIAKRRGESKREVKRLVRQQLESE